MRCKVCDQYFKRYQLLKEHYDEHVYNPQLKCGICGELRNWLVTHHITYFPEETIDICRKCHRYLHTVHRDSENWYYLRSIYCKYDKLDPYLFYKLKQGELMPNV